MVASETRKLSDHTQIAANEIIDLTNASADQNTNAQYINETVQNFNNVIQQNTQSAEEISNSAKELKEQSNNLETVVNKFTIKHK